MAAIACLVAIAYFSNQPFGKQDLRSEIAQHKSAIKKVQEMPAVKISFGDDVVSNTDNPVDFVQFWIRKGAHVLIYGMLVLALVAALSGFGLSSTKSWILAGAVSIVVAVLDEWHQTIVPGRTGRSIDVWVDLLSFVLAVLFAWFVRKAGKILGLLKAVQNGANKS